MENAAEATPKETLAQETLEAWNRLSRKARADFLDLVGAEEIYTTGSPAFRRGLQAVCKPSGKKPIIDLTAQEGGNGFRH